MWTYGQFWLDVFEAGGEKCGSQAGSARVLVFMVVGSLV